MPTLKLIPDSYLTPARPLPEQELADMMVGNPDAARLLTYGLRDVHGAYPPHDHAQDGGEVLVYHPVARLSFGPDRQGSGSTRGVVITGQLITGEQTFDAALGPRPIAMAGLWLPGGVLSLEGYLLVEVDQFEAMRLHVSLRPYGQSNKTFGAGFSLGQTLVFTPATAQHAALLSFPDVSSMGDSRFDREVELVIWQDYAPSLPITFGERLVALYLDAGLPSTPQAGARDANRLDLPRQTVSYADVKAGAILGQDVGRKMRATHNGLLRGMIGRAPGLLNNDDASDLQRPYRQEVFSAHQHQGIDVPDGCGGYWSDGAALRDTYFSINFMRRPLAAFPIPPNLDYRGLKIHAAGDLGVAWVQVEQRVSIPSGLGALDLRFSMEPGSDMIESRLLLHADVRGFDGVSICRGISSGNHRHAAALDAGGLYVCEVDPLDSDAAEPSRKRRLTRKGLWTRDARRLTGLSSRAGVRDTLHQISESVRLILTHPKLDPAQPLHVTTDYVVTLRWELPIVGAATAYDPFAEVRWALGVGAKGF